MFSNDVNRIRKHKNNLRFIYKECRCNFNKVDCEVQDKTNMLLRTYNVKREVFGKLNGVNCRRFVKNCIDIIDELNLYTEMSKCIVFDIAYI